MKVNHAGEHGAICIYRGQIAMARWRAPQLIEDLPTSWATSCATAMCSRPNSDGAGGGVASATIVRAGRQGSFWPRLLLPLVGAATSLVIWTGTRLP